jgi:hypothetical protein
MIASIYYDCPLWVVEEQLYALAQVEASAWTRMVDLALA